jgi:hypothetical protein
MPPEYLQIVDYAGSGDTDLTSHSFADDEPELEFQIGQRVRHPTLGLGRIVNMMRSASSTKAEVEFERIGRKTLILQYARLSVV